MRRAEAAGHQNAPVAALGYALLAQDFGASPEDLANFRGALENLPATAVPQLASLKINLPAPRSVTRKAPTVPRATASSSRPARAVMLDRILDAVVTISAGEKGGSGFFIGDTGLVLTNAHVVEGATKIIVRTRSKETFLAAVQKLSVSDDLALLRVSGVQVSGLSLAATDTLDVGTDVIAIGSPLGLEGTVTRGIVSALRRLDNIPLVQIDAAISPGNSGGPLITEDGRVVGVNTLKVTGKSAESIGFAIAAGHVRAVFGSLLTR
jgi:putative serine protease PepD